jgi:hypothetical protein
VPIARIAEPADQLANAVDPKSGLFQVSHPISKFHLHERDAYAGFLASEGSAPHDN